MTIIFCCCDLLINYLLIKCFQLKEHLYFQCFSIHKSIQIREDKNKKGKT